MIYENDDVRASDALERARTGCYGDEELVCGDNAVYNCPVCGARIPQTFYINDDDVCVGCSECVYRSDTP